MILSHQLHKFRPYLSKSSGPVTRQSDINEPFSCQLAPLKKKKSNFQFSHICHHPERCKSLDVRKWHLDDAWLQELGQDVTQGGTLFKSGPVGPEHDQISRVLVCIILNRHKFKSMKINTF